VDVGKIVGVLGGASRAIQLHHDELGKSDDGVERSPQLVSHVREKIALGPVGKLGMVLGFLQLARPLLAR